MYLTNPNPLGGLNAYLAAQDAATAEQERLDDAMLKIERDVLAGKYDNKIIDEIALFDYDASEFDILELRKCLSISGKTDLPPHITAILFELYNNLKMKEEDAIEREDAWLARL
ncbi:MAG: hypothetical protein Q4G42_03570 [Neisseria sp.]|nr:hypothetical protein [Neisseria sp.]